MYGSRLAVRITEDIKPTTLLDIGCGLGSDHFCKAGIKVDGIGLNDCDYKHENFNFTKISFQNVPNFRKYDIVWSSHTLEHVEDIGQFLRKCLDFATNFVAIVVPNDRNDILIDGHINFFTPASLMYHMVLAGFDLSQAEYYTRGRDIGILAPAVKRSKLDLSYDTGDLLKLQPYFPTELMPRNTDPWLPDKWTQ